VLAVLLALAAAAGYGGSDYWAGLATRRTSVIRVTILAEATGVLGLALVLPWTGLPAPTAGSLAWGAAGGVGGAAGALALYLGFRNAAFSVAAPLSAVGAAGFSVLVGLLLGEHPGGLALAGIALALPAIVGVSASSPGAVAPAAGEDPAGEDPGGEDPGGQDSGGQDAVGADPGGDRPAGDRAGGAGRHAQGVIWGLVAGAGFALLFIALNRAGQGGGLWPVATAQVTSLAVVAALGAGTGDLHLPAAGGRGLAVLTGAAGAGGTLLFFLATQAGLLAVTAVLTSLYPAVTIVLARLLLGERLTAIRLAGLGLAAASVGLIAAGGAG
jgi:drug/metabolite transporter (DMT)-like permease